MDESLPGLTRDEHEFCTRISTRLSHAAISTNVPWMEAYMKHHFHYLGVKTPQRRALVNEVKHEASLHRLEFVALWLFEQPFREMHYAALDLLEADMRKAPVERIELYQLLLERQQWWDSVDTLAAKLIGFHLGKFPHFIPQYVDRWMSSGDMWQQRTCILFQLHYKSNTDTDLLLKIIKEMKGSREFFIQKAIGWALRQYSRTDPSWVRGVVNAEGLMPLSKREAMRLVGP